MTRMRMVMLGCSAAVALVTADAAVRGEQWCAEWPAVAGIAMVAWGFCAEGRRNRLRT